MEWFDTGWGLSLVVFLPAVGALAVLAIPKAQEELLKLIALAFAGRGGAQIVLLGAEFLAMT